MEEVVVDFAARTPTVDWRVAWLWKLRRGRPVSLRFYRGRAEALEAVGLKD